VETAVDSVGQRFVKTPDGTIYGPVDVVTLCTWAADARVIPGCTISKDGKVWKPAVEMPELRLNWVVKLSDGSSYGPLNLLAVWTLMLEGSIQRGMPVVEYNGTRKAQVDDTLLPLLVEESRTLLCSTGKLATELLGVIHEWRRRDEAALVARDGMVKELLERLDKAEGELAAHIKLMGESQRYLAAREHVAGAAESHARENELLRADVHSAQGLLKQSEQQILEAVRNLEEGKRRQAEMVSQMEGLRAQVVEGEKRQKEWSSRLSVTEEEFRKVRDELALTVEREKSMLTQSAAEEKALNDKLLELSGEIEHERLARRAAEGEKQTEIDQLKTEIGEWESRFRQVLDDVKKFDSLLHQRDAEMATYRMKAEEREAEMASRLLALKREADTSGRRVQESRELLTQAQQQTSEARKEAVEVERRLRDQLEAVQRDLNGIMMAYSSGKPAAAPVVETPGKVNWLDGGKRASGGAPSSRVITDASAPVEQQLTSLREALQESTGEKQALRYALDNLRTSHEDFKKDTQARGSQLQQDIKATATMLQQALGEVERREAQLRVMRKNAEEREAELLTRIEELESSVGRSVIVDPEVIRPGEPDRSTGQGPSPVKGKGHPLLNTVEAQLRSELKKWDSLAQAGDGKQGSVKKWFRRK
jgi:DNA repair exonuclease SbcCD ATPase subunit